MRFSNNLLIIIIVLGLFIFTLYYISKNNETFTYDDEKIITAKLLVSDDNIINSVKDKQIETTNNVSNEPKLNLPEVKSSSELINIAAPLNYSTSLENTPYDLLFTPIITPIDDVKNKKIISNNQRSQVFSN